MQEGCDAQASDGSAGPAAIHGTGAALQCSEADVTDRLSHRTDALVPPALGDFLSLTCAMKSVSAVPLSSVCILLLASATENAYISRTQPSCFFRSSLASMVAVYFSQSGATCGGGGGWCTSVGWGEGYWCVGGHGGERD